VYAVPTCLDEDLGDDLEDSYEYTSEEYGSFVDLMEYATS